MTKKEKDFYHDLRKQIRNFLHNNLDKEKKWADYLLAAPDMFHLLVKLSTDSDVPGKKKVKLAAGVAYFISPIDFLPEAIVGPIGFLDDIAVAAYILNDLLNDIDPQIVLKHWAGDDDLLYLIKNVMVNADKMLGGGAIKKIMKKFD